MDQRGINHSIIIATMVTFVSFTIIGVWRSYSPIPQGDDWLQYLGFYVDVLDGKYSAWFAQFHQHRLSLPRVLYWLDIRYFGGRFVFLIFANIVILCGAIAILSYIRRLTNERCVQFVVGATICIMAVSWLHYFNLTTGSAGAQWFLAMLLPLLAFYWLALAQEQQHFFWLALLAGFASAWTSANGILVLPLITVLSLFIKLKPRHIITLALASVASIALYVFFGSDKQSSLLPGIWSTLRGEPVGVAQFALGFLGNPFFCIAAYPLAFLQYLFQSIAGEWSAPRPSDGTTLSDYPMAFSFGLYVAQAAGLVLIAVAILLARHWFRTGREATRGALLTFLLFIILSAIAAAVARFNIAGIEGSVWRQFTTVAMFGWIALIVLIAPSLNLRRALGVFACIALLLFPSQMLPVFGLRGIEIQHERYRQAMQAILQGSDDPEILSVLFADRGVVRRLRGTKVSIFANAP